MRVVDDAADALAALEATTTVQEPAAAVPSESNRRQARLSLAGSAVLGAVAVVLIAMWVGILPNPVVSEATWLRWVFAGLSASLVIGACWLSVRAGRVRDGLSAGLAGGFAIGGVCLTLGAVTSVPVGGTTGEPLTTIALSCAVVAAAVGVVLTHVPFAGRVVGWIVRYVWFVITVVVVLVGVSVILVTTGALGDGVAPRNLAVAAGIVGILLAAWGEWRLRSDLQLEGRPANAALVIGADFVVLAALAVAIGAGGDLSGQLVFLFLIAGGWLIVGALTVEFESGGRVAAAMEGIFEWASEDEVADHLSEAAEALVEALEEVGASPKHSNRMIEHTVGIARQLDLPPARLRVLGLGALFHDVGTGAIPDEVLNKPGTLTDAERSLIEMHTETGYAMASRVHLLWEAALAIRHHHEWVDGSGYPDGLLGDEIPVEARVIAVADMYDALTTPRPYRDALSSDQALIMMRAEVDTHLDPDCYEAFCRYLAERDAVIVPFHRSREPGETR